MMGPIPGTCPACAGFGCAACVGAGMERLAREMAGPTPAPRNARLVAACRCEEHDYCDEFCLCGGVAALPRPGAVTG